MTAAERRLRRAAMAARRFIARARVDVIQSHSCPAGSSDVKHVTDALGLAWIADHDNVLRKLDKALKDTKPGKKP